MELSTVIVSLLVILLSLCFAIYIRNRFKENFYDLEGGYSHFTNQNKDLDSILQQFTSLINTSDNSFRNITDTHIFTENNMKLDVQNDISFVINRVFKTINPSHNVKYTLLNIERVKVEENILKSKRYSVVFLLHELDKFSNRKILLQYTENNNKKITLNHIRTLQSNTDDSSNIKPHDNTPNPAVLKDVQIDRQLELLNNLCCGKQKCQHGLNLVTASEHKPLKLKLTDGCVIETLPKHISRPFMNPTMFVTP